MPSWSQFIGPVGQEILGWGFLGLLLVILFFIKRGITKMLAHYSIKSYLKNNNETIDTLAYLKHDTHADRVHIMMFHNGDHYINGSSILKLACSYESVMPGISAICGDAAPLLVSQIPEMLAFMENLDARKYTAVTIHGKALPACYYKSILKVHAVETEILCPLYKADNIVGCIRLQYITREVPPEALAVLIETAPQIELHVNKNHQDSKWWQLWRK